MISLVAIFLILQVDFVDPLCRKLHMFSELSVSFSLLLLFLGSFIGLF